MEEAGRVRGLRRGRNAFAAAGAGLVGLGLVVQAALFASPAQATGPANICIWAGGTTGVASDMSVAANWQVGQGTCGTGVTQNSASLSGAQLVFPASVPTNAPTLDTNESPDDLVFDNSYTISESSSSVLSLSGTANGGQAVTVNNGATVLIAPPVTLTASQTDSTGSTGFVVYESPVSVLQNNSWSLTVTGNGFFDSSVGSSADTLSSLSVSGVSQIEGNVWTTGTQLYSSTAALDGSPTLTGSTVTFGGKVNAVSAGSSGLTVAGNAVFDSTVGPPAFDLSSLAVTGASTLDGSVTTSGTQTYDGATTLGANVDLAGSTVTFESTVNSATSTAESLTVTGNAVFDDVVGSSHPLNVLHVTGNTTINTTSIASSGTQTYDGAATLDANSALAGSTVTFGSTVDAATSGGESLTVTGNGVFDGAVGGTHPPSTLSVSGTTSIGGNVTTTGNQTYSGAATITTTAATLAAPLVTFSSSVDGISNVTPSALTVTGDAAFAGSVNPNRGLKTISVSGKVSTTTALSMTTTTTYNVAIGGTPASLDFTQITVGNAGGGVNLGTATLSVSFFNSYTSAAGAVYDILANNTGSAITGTFSGLPQGAYIAGGTRIFQISYTGGTSGHDVTLTDVTPVAPASAVASVGTASVIYGAENVETFTDTLTGYTGLLPTGSVTFMSGSTTLCKATTFTKVSTNVETATCGLTATQLPAAASYPVAAVYSGDNSYKGVTSAATNGFAVTKDTTTVTVTPTVTSLTYGTEQVAVFNVTLTTGHGETLPATGESATVTVGGGSCLAILTPKATGATGSCSLGATAVSAGGPYSVDVSYPGDSDLGSSIAKATQTVTVAKASTATLLSISRRVVTFGRESAVVFRVHVNATGATPTGVVAISSSRGRICTIRLSGGTGTCSPGKTQLRAGSYGGLMARYLGTGDFTASQSSPIGSFTIYRDTTVVHLSLSSSRVAYGSEHSIVFTVSVTTHRGERVPNGEKVTVKVGSFRCTVRLQGGTARCRIPNTALRPGTYSVVASYGGDFGRHASRSRAARITVT